MFLFCPSHLLPLWPQIVVVSRRKRSLCLSSAAFLARIARFVIDPTATATERTASATLMDPAPASLVCLVTNASDRIHVELCTLDLSSCD